MSDDNERRSDSTTTERARFPRLLLVEDNASLRLTLAAILENEGFVVTGCATASEALEQMRRKDYGVAVIDLRLPDMQGTELLKEFRALGTQGSCDYQYCVRCLRIGQGRGQLGRVRVHRKGQRSE